MITPFSESIDLQTHHFWLVTLLHSHQLRASPKASWKLPSHDSNWIDCIMNLEEFFFSSCSTSNAPGRPLSQCSISVRLKPHVWKSEIDNTSASFDIPTPCPVSARLCVSPYTLEYPDMCMIYFQLYQGLIMTTVEINKDQGLSV